MKNAMLVLCLLAFTADASAWSREGHELVGELAQRRLSPAAQAEVARLLAAEPDPTLAGVAAWADEIRAESRAAGNPLGKLSEHWHYVNFPRGADCDLQPARDCPDGDCIVGAIDAQRAILADRGRSDAERAQALKFLVHFVGDVHQPMHAGFGHDRGGNNYQIQFRGRGARDGSEGANLHRIWDYWMLASAGLDRSAYADRLQTRSAVAVEPHFADHDVARGWAVESCRLIADTPLYPRGHVLRDDYLDRYRPLAERRLQDAAFRLSALVEAAVLPPR